MLRLVEGGFDAISSMYNKGIATFTIYAICLLRKVKMIGGTMKLSRISLFDIRFSCTSFMVTPSIHLTIFFWNISNSFCNASVVPQDSHPQRITSMEMARYKFRFGFLATALEQKTISEVRLWLWRAIFAWRCICRCLEIDKSMIQVV